MPSLSASTVGADTTATDAIRVSGTGVALATAFPLKLGASLPTRSRSVPVPASSLS